MSFMGYMLGFLFMLPKGSRPRREKGRESWLM